MATLSIYLCALHYKSNTHAQCTRCTVIYLSDMENPKKKKFAALCNNIDNTDKCDFKIKGTITFKHEVLNGEKSNDKTK